MTHYSCMLFFWVQPREIKRKDETELAACPTSTEEPYDLTEGFGENDPVACLDPVEEIEPEPSVDRLFTAVLYKRAWASWEDDDEVDSLACKRPKYL